MAAHISELQLQNAVSPPQPVDLEHKIDPNSSPGLVPVQQAFFPVTTCHRSTTVMNSKVWGALGIVIASSARSAHTSRRSLFSPNLATGIMC